MTDLNYKTYFKKYKELAFNEDIYPLLNDFKTIALKIKNDDAVVLTSVSGESPSTVNAAKTAKDLGLQVITFSGKSAENTLKSIGDINFWVDSRAYNIVECIHMIWVTTVIDSIVGKAEYEV